MEWIASYLTEWYTIAAFLVGMVIAFMLLGIPVAFAFLTANFVGAMIGRFYLEKRFGVERWYAYAPIVFAGYSCGVGLIGMTSIALALISKAVSQVIF